MRAFTLQSLNLNVPDYVTDETVVDALRHPWSAASASSLRHEIERDGASVVLTHGGELVTVESLDEVRGQGHDWQSGQVRTARGGWARAIGSCPVNQLQELLLSHLDRGL